MKRLFLCVAAALLMIACTKELHVTSVTIKPSEASLLVGHTLVLDATVEPAEAPNKTVTWSTDDDIVATVNSTGEVTAIAPGTVKITVTTVDGGYKATCTVTVEKENSPVPVTGVTINCPDGILLVGKSITLEAAVEPEGADNKNVTWSTDDDLVATVNSEGELTAIAPGTVKISVTTDDGGCMAICTVTVEKENLPVPVTGVTIICPEEILLAGKSLILETAVEPAEADNRNIIWSIDDELVATVNSDGEVKAITPGTAKITVTTEDGGFMATCIITVEEVPATGIILNRSAALLLVGKTQTLDATVKSTGAANKTVYWTTSNDLIATVNSACEVTAVAPGTAIITAATDDGDTATCNVTVVATGITMTTNNETWNFGFFMSAGVGKIIIDWGDGALKETDNVSSDELVFGHSYPYPPKYEYTITITGNHIESISCIGYTIPGIDFNNSSIKSPRPPINRLKALDVSSNPVLKKLTCGYNQISSLDLSRNTELTYLDLDHNGIEPLDLSHNTKLTYLNCAFGGITSLDLSHNPALTELHCSHNHFTTTIDLSHNPALTHLSCGYNYLTTLDVSNNPLLEWLGCHNNRLTNLDVSVCTALKNVQCYYNYLTTSALNELFHSLHDNTADGNYLIYVGSNPGASDCDYNIAIEKGWNFF